jgi:hypothetical protein
MQPRYVRVLVWPRCVHESMIRDVRGKSKCGSCYREKTAQRVPAGCGEDGQKAVNVFSGKDFASEIAMARRLQALFKVCTSRHSQPSGCDLRVCITSLKGPTIALGREGEALGWGLGQTTRVSTQAPGAGTPSVLRGGGRVQPKRCDTIRRTLVASQPTLCVPNKPPCLVAYACVYFADPIDGGMTKSSPSLRHRPVGSAGGVCGDDGRQKWDKPQPQIAARQIMCTGYRMVVRPSRGTLTLKREHTQRERQRDLRFEEECGAIPIETGK